MSKQPVFDQTSQKIWDYLNHELSENETVEFEKQLQGSTHLRQQLLESEQILKGMGRWENQPAPDWDPQTFYPRPTKIRWTNWLSLGMATAALVFSLMPYIHIDELGLVIGPPQEYVSKVDFKHQLEDFGWQQSLAVSERIDQLKTDQSINNRELVSSILTYSETRRRNDLLQMASWVSQEKELNTAQQRQIVTWVQNEQQQDNSQLKALWTQVVNQNNEVSNQ